MWRELTKLRVSYKVDSIKTLKFHLMPSKFNGRYLRGKICIALGIEDPIQGYHDFLRKLYKNGMSGVEISEMIFRDTEIKIDSRSIQRIIASYGETRNLKESFHNAIKRGRVIWQFEEEQERKKNVKHQISKKLRFEILERDNFTCVLCGAKTLLQIDHKIARMNGGEDTLENLRTLCIDCNIGKQLVEGEHSRGENHNSLKSGKKLKEMQNLVASDGAKKKV